MCNVHFLFSSLNKTCEFLVLIQGFEHLMHKLGIGGLDFPEKHTIDEHRPDGFRIPDINYDESTTTENLETTTAGVYFEIQYSYTHIYIYSALAYEYYVSGGTIYMLLLSIDKSICVLFTIGVMFTLNVSRNGVCIMNI